jgi:hypothetical protein
MRKLLLQLDSSSHPSVFDRVVAFDAGADEVLSYGGVTEDTVPALVHGAVFTRRPKDLRHTAIFIGGTDTAAGERLLAAVRAAFFGSFRVSVMLDANGSNTTAVAAVMKLSQATALRGCRTVVAAGTGPVGTRAAGLLARAGADVVITSRQLERGTRVAEAVRQRFGGTVGCVVMHDAAQAASVLEGAEVLLSAGPAGACLVPLDAWAGSAGLRIVVDLNAVPPPGVAGVEPHDDGVVRDGATVFGALAVGTLKMTIHKACLARLFERNDLVLDVEAIAEVAHEVGVAQG